MNWIALAASVVTALLSFLGVYMSNRKNAALVEYRMMQLEKKVDKHNQVIERTYELEKRAAVIETEIEELKSKAG
jgi:C4-dicarboxylate-specific signal transduction histidine kinase